MKQQKGSILVFSLVIMGIITTGAISIMVATTATQKIANVSDDAAVAFQVADTGVESVYYTFLKGHIDKLDDVASLIPHASCSSGRISVSKVSGISDGSYIVSFFKGDGSRVNRCNSSVDVLDIRSAEIIGYYGQSARTIKFTVNVSTSDIADGLVGHWPFDGDTKDATSGGNDGVKHGASNVSSGNPIGSGALKFDGHNDYVRIPDDSNFRFDSSDDYSISLWTKLQDVTVESGIFHKKNSYEIWYKKPPKRIHYQGIISSESIVRDKWYHVVLWQKGSTGDRGIYINGQLKGFDTPRISNDHSDILVGARYVGASVGKYSKGVIDDIRIYDRALEISEVMILCKMADTSLGISCN